MARWTDNRWVRAGLKAVLAGVGVVVALVVAEFAARLLFPSWAPATADRLFWVYDAQLGWFHRPGETGVFKHPDFAVRVTINSQGLRDDEYPLARVPGKRRLLVVGDSQAWGYGVEHDEIFTELLERRRPDWEIINAAVSGFGTDQEYLYYRERGAKFHPDVVLVLMHENDFENNARSYEYWHAKPRFVLDGGGLRLKNSPVPRPTARERVGRFILGRTYLYATLYRTFTKPHARPHGSPAPTEPAAGPTASPPSPSQDSDAAAQTPRGKAAQPSPDKAVDVDGSLTVAILRAFAESARENQARLVVVSAPMNSARVGLLTQALGDAGVPYLPLDEAFGRAQRSYRFAHDKHWNAYGHTVAADAVDAFLIDRGIWGTPTPAVPARGESVR